MTDSADDDWTLEPASDATIDEIMSWFPDAASVDIWVKTHGGGFAAQAGAIALGISRALVQRNPDYEHVLREGRFLTRDSRVKERKKYGRRGARRSFQFSKR